MPAPYASRSDLLICEEIAAVLKDPTGAYKLALLIPYIDAAQSSVNTGRPLLTIYHDPMDHFGPNTRRAVLHFELKSRAGDDGNGQLLHQQQFDALFIALLGNPKGGDMTASASRSAAKTAIKTAIAARGKVIIQDYGPVQSPIENDIEGLDLRTLLKVGIIWSFQ